MRIGRMFAKVVIATIATATIGVTLPAAAFANSSSTSPQAVETLDKVKSNLVVAAVPSISDANSAAQTAVVDIPTDPTDGVKLTGKTGEDLRISIPGAKHSGKAYKSRKGVVTYVGNDSTNAAIPTNEGVQLLTVIKNRRAPQSYSYSMQLPAGATIKVMPEGVALVLGKDNQVYAAVAAPWAKDANGKSVKTYFTTDGNTLTQHVEHRTSGIAYPVTADPYYIRWWGIEVQLNRSQTNKVMFGATAAAVAGLWIPDATISKIVASILGLFSGYANWAYNNGACLAMGRWLVGLALLRWQLSLKCHTMQEGISTPSCMV